MHRNNRALFDHLVRTSEQCQRAALVTGTACVRSIHHCAETASFSLGQELLPSY
jgi:hypothetical protein